MVHCENTPFRRLLCNMNIKIRNITSALLKLLLQSSRSGLTQS